MNSSSFSTYRKRKQYANQKGQLVTKWSRPKPSLIQLASQIGKIKRQLNTEQKFIFNNFTTATIANTATIQNLTVVDQGLTDQTRVGNSMKVVYLSLQMLFTIHASASFSQVRVILVRDTQTNGAAFSTNDLLNDGSVFDCLVSHYNQTSGKRFIILRDTLVQLSAQAGPSSILNWSIPQQVHIEYSSTGSGVADIVDNSYSLFLIASEATNQPSITASIITKFVDN
jgi:hypothetical protein